MTSSGGSTSGPGPIPLLFLVADTGGGHRSAARAVGQAVEAMYPGQFTPVLYDPLGGPQAHRLLRRVSSLYGPTIRRAPWLWGAAYHCFASPPALGMARATLSALAGRALGRAVAECRPATIVSFHPLLSHTAADSGRRDVRRPPVLTVVTDLVTAHPAWRYGKVDRIVVPSAMIRRRCQLDGFTADRCVETGLPVTSEFWAGPVDPRGRATIRRRLRVPDGSFLVVIAGGAEGSGDIAGQAAALLDRFGDVTVAAICGRNAALQRRLTQFAAHVPGRLRVTGFVDTMADWLRAADVVVTKAGPTTIAEATCCGTPLVLTSSLPGQEKGNAEFVVDAGAGREARTRHELVRVIQELRQSRFALAAMRASSARLGRPDAAAEIASLIAGSLVPVHEYGRSA